MAQTRQIYIPSSVKFWLSLIAKDVKFMRDKSEWEKHEC